MKFPTILSIFYVALVAQIEIFVRAEEGVKKNLIRNYPTVFQRIRSFFNRERSDEELKKGIADLYDKCSSIWYDVWGDHLHHGFYYPNSSTTLRDAQIEMIERYGLTTRELIFFVAV